MSNEYDTVEWKCFFCKARGREVQNNVRHLNRHFWEWVRQETAVAQRDSDLWRCRLDGRPCRSERAFRGHMWHEHAADWMEAWSCWQDVDVNGVV